VTITDPSTIGDIEWRILSVTPQFLFVDASKL